jgi:hypothetical protein
MNPPLFTQTLQLFTEPTTPIVECSFQTINHYNDSPPAPNTATTSEWPGHLVAGLRNSKMPHHPSPTTTEQFFSNSHRADDAYRRVLLPIVVQHHNHSNPHTLATTF